MFVEGQIKLVAWFVFCLLGIMPTFRGSIIIQLELTGRAETVLAELLMGGVNATLATLLFIILLYQFICQK